jgi:hypothetical protein
MTDPVINIYGNGDVRLAEQGGDIYLSVRKDKDGSWYVEDQDGRRVRHVTGIAVSVEVDRPVSVTMTFYDAKNSRPYVPRG